MNSDRSYQKKRIDKKIVEVKVEEKAKPIMLGIATTDLIVNITNSIKKGEMTGILEDKGDDWLTEIGLISKMFLLLKKL